MMTLATRLQNQIFICICTLLYHCITSLSLSLFYPSMMRASLESKLRQLVLLNQIKDDSKLDRNNFKRWNPSNSKSDDKNWIWIKRLLWFKSDFDWFWPIFDGFSPYFWLNSSVFDLKSWFNNQNCWNTQKYQNLSRFFIKSTKIGKFMSTFGHFRLK